jgi:hypothetical protein
MPEKCATKGDATSISKQLTAALGEAQVLQIARECRWLRRQASAPWAECVESFTPCAPSGDRS